MNEKSIVETIKKLSQEMPGVEPSNRVGPSASIPEMPGVGHPNHGGVSSGTSQIAQMQRELIALAQSVVPFDPIAPPKPEEQRFSEFLSDHMATNLGVAFPSAKSPTNQNVVIEAMKRIANQKSKEFRADGKWGPLTNAALHNALAIGVSTYKLAHTFRVPTDLSEPVLKDFNSNIPATSNDATPAQKIAIAPDLIKHIRDVHISYNQVKDAVKNTRSYTNYVAKHPFHTYKTTNVLAEPELKNLRDAFDNSLKVFFPYGNKVAIPIKIDDLVSPDAFAHWYAPNAKIVGEMVPAELLKYIGTAPDQNYQPGTKPTQPLPNVETPQAPQPPQVI